MKYDGVESHLIRNSFTSLVSQWLRPFVNKRAK